jgi:propionate CoA-transferase
MDPRIFRDASMELLDTLISLRLDQRIGYDAGRNNLFLNFEGMVVRTAAHIGEIRAAVEKRCRDIGRKVAVVVNYDAFRIDDQLLDAYSDMVSDMEASYYSRVSRYTTSAFMRMKLGRALTRTVAPHVFESREEAQAFLERK